MLKYYWLRVVDAWHSWRGHYHDWDWDNGEGEHCVKCGEGDWMAERLCSVTDKEHQNKKAKKK